ncbi:hypothetical protein GCM10023116_29510 [Kistimonas scapharcae]|uniref:Uncharacterized protein n=2 Tax=Kistimonas scapharcae TaxID=1036133 RepID=A0ABP8V364_9GAMM
MEDQLKAEELKQQYVEEQNTKAQRKNESLLGQIPSWAMEPLPADATGFFGTGMGRSDSLSNSRKVAKLDAEFELAKTISQEISGSERLYTQENSGGITKQYEALIDKLVTNIPVVGYDTVKSETISINGMYYSFVLLKMPYDEYNAIIQQQLSESTDQKIQAAFLDLERRIEKRRQQAIEKAENTSPDESIAPETRSQQVDGSSI